MVQLKEYLEPLQAGQTVTFQFHNGSIKSEYKCDLYAATRLISIPQWFN